jgi:hypothetical protein
MKTAMKNLIEKIAYENEFGTWMTGLVEDSNISDMVEKALKEERQQIEDAWDTAYQAGRFEGKGIAKENWQTFDNYFTEKFEQ